MQSFSFVSVEKQGHHQGFFFLKSDRPTDPISGNAFDDKRKKKGGFFFLEIRPTDPISGNAFDDKRKKRGGVGGGERWTFY